MLTLSLVVEKIVKNSYLLEEGLSLGIINLSALSRQIKPEVEKQTLKKFSEGAILMALKRLAFKIKSKKTYKELFQKAPEIILRSNLIEFSLINSPSLMAKINKLFSLVYSANYFLTITQGISETGIIISQEKERMIIPILKKEQIVNVINNLSAVTIKLPKENISTPGVYYFILKILAWEKINVVEVVSTACEFTIILADQDVDRAFSILKQTLCRS